MNKRITKKLFKQKLYGLKDNDYIIMEYDIKFFNPSQLDFIYKMLCKDINNNKLIMIPNFISMKSIYKGYVKQIRDKLTEIVGD